MLMASSGCMPFVSYVVTVYNKAMVLPFVTAGLGAQEDDFEREFIFVDDGSTDGSADRLRELTAGWANVTIVSQTNAGPARAFNAGIKLARGDFIKPVDGDDLLFPWATARLLEAIETTGYAVACAPQSATYDPASSVADVMASLRRQPGTVVRWDDALRRCLRRAQTNPSAWLARSETVRASGGCDERVFIQDYSIELRLAALGPFAKSSEPLFLSPEVATERLSANQGQTLHDMNFALANFIADRPDLPRDLARLAFTRAAARAWAWARRHGGNGPAWREFRLNCGARLRLLAPSAANVRATCAAFTRTNSIRLGDGTRTDPG